MPHCHRTCTHRLFRKLRYIVTYGIPIVFRSRWSRGFISSWNTCTATVEALSQAGILAEADWRDDNPGWKYSDWEIKGAPLRIEIGLRDLAKNQARAVRRDNGAKEDISRDNLVEKVKDLLADIQQSLFDAAKKKRDACIQVVTTWDKFIQALSQNKLILAPWCDEEEVEDDVKARIKKETGAAVKTLCSPFDFDQLPIAEGTKCFGSGKPAKIWTYWGRSY